jgi:aminoglycoside phosphotransferase
VHFYAIDTTWIVPASSCVSLGRVDEEVRAHVEWAGRRIAEENGKALEPPPGWRKHLAGLTVLFQSIGESGAQVYRIGDALFLKSEPITALAELPGEIERLRWLGDTGIPCPEIVDTTTYADRHWLLMSALPGRDLAQSPDIGPIAACEIVAQALRTLHSLDPSVAPSITAPNTASPTRASG